MPMPVSQLSDTELGRCPREILFPEPRGLDCQADSWPGTNPEESTLLEPEKHIFKRLSVKQVIQLQNTRLKDVLLTNF